MSKKKASIPPRGNQTANAKMPDEQNVQTATKPIPIWHIVLVFAASFLLYANTLGHGYTQDDAIVITENMFTQKGIKGIGGILKYDTFYGFFKEEGKAALVSGGRYRPLTLMMFAIERQFFGNSTFMYHLFNVLYYGLLAIILYLLLRKLLIPLKNISFAETVALACTILFVAHPLHTEVVANIKGRDEIITLLCALSALYCSLVAYDERKPNYLIWAGGLALLGLLSKEYPAVFVAVVPLTFWVFRPKAATSEIIKQTLPYVGALFVFLVMRTAALGWQFGGTPPVELMNNPFLKFVGGQYVPFSGLEKMATIFYTLLKYLILLIFPSPLTHDYYPLQIERMTFANWQATLSLLLHLGGGAWATWAVLRKRSVLGYCVLYYLLTLVLVSNLLFPIGTNMAERFLFMPSVGFCLAITFLCANFLKIGQNQNTAPLPYFGLLGIIVLAFAFKTFTRNAVWHDNYTLFTTDIKTSPQSAKLRNAVGGETIAKALEEKDENKRKDMITSAIPHLQEAIRLHPQYKNAFLLLGNAHYYLKNFDEAEKSYLAALALDSDYLEAKNNMSLVYEEKGKLAGEQGQHTLAIQYFSKALESQPENAKLWFFLGATQGMANQPQAAIESMMKALEKSPTKENHARIFENLSTAYAQLGDAAKATEYKNKAAAATSGGQ